MRRKLRARLEDVCGDSLYCDIGAMETICQEILEEQMERTNQIFKRRRRRGEPVDNLAEIMCIVFLLLLLWCLLQGHMFFVCFCEQISNQS